MRLEVLDVLERNVATLADATMLPGSHSVERACRDCAAGLYFVRMKTLNGMFARKMVLLK